MYRLPLDNLSAALRFGLSKTTIRRPRSHVVHKVPAATLEIPFRLA